jgi:hypothetical protein
MADAKSFLHTGSPAGDQGAAAELFYFLPKKTFGTTSKSGQARHAKDTNDDYATVNWRCLYGGTGC